MVTLERIISSIGVNVNKNTKRLLTQSFCVFSVVAIVDGTPKLKNYKNFGCEVTVSIILISLQSLTSG